MPGKRLTADQQAQITRMWADSISHVDIAAAVGVSTPTVWRFLDKQGLNTRRDPVFYKKHKNALTETSIAEILALWDAGSTIRQIASVLGVSQDTVVRYTKMANKARRKHVTDQEVVDAFLHHKAIRPVIAALGVGEKRIKAVLLRNGISHQMFMRRYDDMDWDSVDLPALLEQHDGSVNAIHKATGIPFAFLTKRIDEQGITFDRKRWVRLEQIPEDIKQGVIDLYHQAYTTDEILEASGITEHMFRRILKSCNVAQRFPSRVPNDQYPEFLEYTKKVRRLTRLTLEYLALADPRAGFHWNHKVSVVDGFLCGVPIDVMAGVENLELVTAIENLMQGFRSKISVDELFELRGKKRGRCAAA